MSKKREKIAIALTESDWIDICVCLQAVAVEPRIMGSPTNTYAPMMIRFSETIERACLKSRRKKHRDAAREGAA